MYYKTRTSEQGIRILDSYTKGDKTKALEFVSYDGHDEYGSIDGYWTLFVYVENSCELHEYTRELKQREYTLDKKWNLNDFFSSIFYKNCFKTQYSNLFQDISNRYQY